MVVPEHPLHVQVLEGDDLVLAHQPRGLLVQELVPYVRDPLVDAGDPAPLLLYVPAFGERTFPYGPALRVIPGDIRLDPAGELPLFAAELLFIDVKGRRTRDGFPVAPCIEGTDPDINADHAAAVRCRHYLFLDTEGDEIPAGRCTGNGGVQDPTTDVPGSFDPDRTELREIQPVPFETDPVVLVPGPVGLYGRMLLPVFRMPGPFGEEVPVSTVEILDGFLKGHAVAVPEPGGPRVAPHGRDFPHALEGRDVPSFGGVCLLPVCQAVVVDIAAATKKGGYLIRLFTIGIYTEPIAFLLQHYRYLVFWVST